MKKLIGITFLTLLLSVLSSVASAQVLNPDNGHQYEVVAVSGMTWDNAKTAAATRQLGGPLCSGYLATVTSAEEDGFIKTTFGSATWTKWLGGIQDNPNEIGTGWKWITGEPWGYTGWNSLEPNNRTYPNFPSGEDALNYYNPGGWNDAPRGWTGYTGGGYIVEYNCFQVAIDIKPGSDPNCFNLNGTGVIPIAILGSGNLDVNNIDPLSLNFQGMTVRIRGNSGPQCSVQKVNGDTYNDLVCQFVDDPSEWISGNTSAEVTGALLNGAVFKGSDSICVVNQNLNP